MRIVMFESPLACEEPGDVVSETQSAEGRIWPHTASGLNSGFGPRPPQSWPSSQPQPAHRANSGAWEALGQGSCVPVLTGRGSR